jgi:hypothetical protein
LSQLTPNIELANNQVIQDGGKHPERAWNKKSDHSAKHRRASALPNRHGTAAPGFRPGESGHCTNQKKPVPQKNRMKLACSWFTINIS